MEWVETTGKTVEEAKDTALDQLGVDEQDAEFEVLEEPKTGLFGRVRGEARVRARVTPKVLRPKQERRRKSSGDSAKKAASPKGGRSKAAPASSNQSVPKADEAQDTPSAADDTERAPKPRAATSAASERTPRTKRTDSAKAEESRPTVEDSVTVEEQAEIMEEFLEGLLDAFGAEGTVSSSKVDEDTIEIEVNGDDLGLLIGPKGNTLQAVQDMARTVVQRQAAGHHEGRVRVDIGGYRQRRREALSRFATQIAEQVRDSGEAKSLEPMGAADRKIVHDTVNEIDGVHTRSDGQDPDRWVVILPDAD